MSFFELGMLVCFGFSWPISVYKSIKMKTTTGKSLIFSVVIWFGYICGIIHKLFYSRDVVMYVYFFNLMMVTLDLIVYGINLRRDKQREATI